MGDALSERVVAITGAGNGIGREHALLFASEGARVVVNDLGGAGDGTGADAGAAQKVVDEIVSAGGEAVAHTEDISAWSGGASLVQTAVDAFGRLDALVNNAGILRDAFIGSMSEQQWDAVIQVHLKGHFVALRHAVE
ncbi:MAG TPA: SDR family NAD(P)-dependent oxidoreductase, partial [Solirubrobacteraceae bacterium]|nr:SDR family NAD(P)-dependent oxidoreductase [Solirubrobacteraceae bacterium]